VGLTDRERDLLCAVVSQHERTNGEPFIFVHSRTARGIVSNGGISIPVNCDNLDVRSLSTKRLIDLTETPEVIRGKPTDFGVAVGRILALPPSGASPQPDTAANYEGSGRVRIRGFLENGLLAPLPGESVYQLFRARELHIRKGLAAADEHVNLDPSGSAREAGLFRWAVRQVTASSAAECVRSYAESLVLSQQRLGAHARIVREFTSLVIVEFRKMLGASKVLYTEPQPTWHRDPVAQRAIQACEEAIEESKKEGDALPYGPQDPVVTNRTWSPVVIEWEAYKEREPTAFRGEERITESALRTILVNHFSVTPDNGQIDQAGADLARHYESIVLIPLALESLPPPSPPPEPVASAQFWKEREDEFRKYNTEVNTVLGGRWCDGRWSFYPGSGRLSAESVELFKSLAREATKGLRSSHGVESWTDWLDHLRLAKDGETEKRLWSKAQSGSSIIGERELERRKAAGEEIPADPLTLFCLAETGTVAKQLYWDTSSATLDNLFEISAFYCVILRSHASDKPEDDADSGPTEDRPLGKNPFTSGTAEYQAFEEATWKAKRDIGNDKLELQRGKYESAHEFLAAALTYWKRWFSACAFEATVIVGEEMTGTWYEQWVDELFSFVVAGAMGVLRLKLPGADMSATGFFCSEDLRLAEEQLVSELSPMVTHYKRVAADRVVEVFGHRNTVSLGRNAAGEALKRETDTAVAPGKAYKTELGRNIDRLRKQCGWSFDDIALATGIDKKSILGHVNEGQRARPSTIVVYADTFSEKLGRNVTVAELEGAGDPPA
jgi:hypothetical protein